MPKEESPWQTLNVRRSLRTKGKADKLARLLTKIKGVRVYPPDAVDLALSEAIERAERKAAR